MALIVTELRETGTREVIQLLAGLEKRAQDLRPAFAVVANLLEGHAAQTFATAGGRIGKPWAVLRPRTIEARARRWGYYGLRSPNQAGPSGPILRWSGRLARSFARGGVAHIRTVSSKFLRWGSGVRYGVFHDGGRGRRRRVILGFQDAFQRREILFQPIRLYLQGTPPGAIAAVVGARTGIGPTGASLRI